MGVVRLVFGRGGLLAHIRFRLDAVEYGFAALVSGRGFYHADDVVVIQVLEGEDVGVVTTFLTACFGCIFSVVSGAPIVENLFAFSTQIGRASCRERV